MTRKRSYQPMFDLTEKVIIDGCDKIVAVVTAVTFRMTGIKYEVSYFGDSGLQEPWIDEWRLSKWEE